MNPLRLTLAIACFLLLICVLLEFHFQNILITDSTPTSSWIKETTSEPSTPTPETSSRGYPQKRAHRHRKLLSKKTEPQATTRQLPESTKQILSTTKQLTATADQPRATIKQQEHHSLVTWEKNGITLFLSWQALLVLGSFLVLFIFLFICTCHCAFQDNCGTFTDDE
nr:hypothetical protein [Macronycteris gammaherpesvirus 1]BEG23151.1 hypothetical protein [Macronycteris gammaherpesvirus 1]